MKKDNRWMKWVLAESADMNVALPWQRTTRQRPAALKSKMPAGSKASVAAR